MHFPTAWFWHLCKDDLLWVRSVRNVWSMINKQIKLLKGHPESWHRIGSQKCCSRHGTTVTHIKFHAPIFVRILYLVCITFTFINLADTFIKSDLQLRGYDDQRNLATFSLNQLNPANQIVLCLTDLSA